MPQPIIGSCCRNNKNNSANQSSRNTPTKGPSNTQANQVSRSTPTTAVNKNQLAMELYAEMLSTYPANAPRDHYVSDSKYIISMLLHHLRCTRLHGEALKRNTSFFKSFLKAGKFSCRNQWLCSMDEAIDFFFPIGLL